MKKILPLVILLTFSFIFYGIYTQATKSIKVKRLDCQEKTTTFERIFAQGPIDEAINSLLNKNYEVKSHIEYSKFMKSNLKNKLVIEDLNKILDEKIKKYGKNEVLSNDKLIINYYLYENDKEDSSKKNDKAKNYPGYVMFDFEYKNQLVYKMQSDYSFIDASDVDERMDCVIKSFISLKRK